MAIDLFAILATATMGSSFGSVYAAGNNDKVKVDCDDVAIALATLFLAVPFLDEGGRDNLDESLQEGEIANNVEEIAGNFQNVRDEVDDECDDLDFDFGFVDFDEDWPD